MDDTAYYYTDNPDIECVVTQCQAQHYPWHMHMRHWVFGAVYAGCVELETMSNTQSLHCGQHFLVPPYISHSVKIAPKSSLLVFCFARLEVLLTEPSLLKKLLYHIPGCKSQKQYFLSGFDTVRLERSFFTPPVCSR